jgi:antitoxin ParD1/3/4
LAILRWDHDFVNLISKLEKPLSEIDCLGWLAALRDGWLAQGERGSHGQCFSVRGLFPFHLQNPTHNGSDRSWHDRPMFALNLDSRQRREYGKSVEGGLPMPMTLQPEHERLIAEALRSGAYQDSGEVIQRALELLRDRDGWLAENRAKIDEGYAAAERGELIDADQVRVQMEERKRAWRAEQRKA